MFIIIRPHRPFRHQAALNLQPGDNVVLTAGPINGQRGNTNTIKVEQV